MLGAPKHPQWNPLGYPNTCLWGIWGMLAQEAHICTPAHSAAYIRVYIYIVYLCICIYIYICVLVRSLAGDELDLLGSLTEVLVAVYAFPKGFCTWIGSGFSGWIKNKQKFDQNLVVVSNSFFNVHPYLWKIPILTSIFFKGVGSTTNHHKCVLGFYSDWRRGICVVLWHCWWFRNPKQPPWDV